MTAKEYYEENVREIIPQLEGFSPRELAEGAYDSGQDIYSYVLELLDINYER